MTNCNSGGVLFFRPGGTCSRIQLALTGVMNTLSIRGFCKLIAHNSVSGSNVPSYGSSGSYMSNMSSVIIGGMYMKSAVIMATAKLAKMSCRLCFNSGGTKGGNVISLRSASSAGGGVGCSCVAGGPNRCRLDFFSNDKEPLSSMMCRIRPLRAQ